MWVVISMYVQGDQERSNKSQLAKLKRSKAKYSVHSKKKIEVQCVQAGTSWGESSLADFI